MMLEARLCPCGKSFEVLTTSDRVFCGMECPKKPKTVNKYAQSAARARAIGAHRSRVSRLYQKKQSRERKRAGK